MITIFAGRRAGSIDTQTYVQLDLAGQVRHPGEKEVGN